MTTELVVVLRLLAALRPRAESIVIGSSRDMASRETAGAIARAWTEHDGEVLDTVDWPEEAASWLRQARRFTAHAPDAWVVVGQVPGWVQMGRRLLASTGWEPARTIATSSLADTALAAFEGLRGAHTDGGIWEIRDSQLISHAPDLVANPK